LIVFDSRGETSPLPEQCSAEELTAEGKRIDVVRL